MKKKTIALLLVMMMVFGITVGGTIAYLTDSEKVVNTFTVGNVQIKLDEAKVDLYGVPQKETGKDDAGNPIYAKAEANDTVARVTATPTS